MPSTPYVGSGRAPCDARYRARCRQTKRYGAEACPSPLCVQPCLRVRYRTVVNAAPCLHVRSLLPRMRYRTAARMLPPHRQFLDALHQERLGSVVLRSHIVLERNDAQRDTHLLCRSNGNRAIHRGGHLVIHRQKRGKEIANLLDIYIERSFL